MNEYKKALFKDGDFEMEVTISPEEKTIWMTQKQMELLFEKSHSTIAGYIKDVLKTYKSAIDNSDKSIVDNVENIDIYIEIIDKSIKRKLKHYNLKIVFAVAQRAKSNRGILLQQFLDNYLKEYESLMEINENNLIIYNNGGIEIPVNVALEEKTVWLSLDQIAMLFESSKSNVSEHIKNIIEDDELDLNRVVRNFRITASDGKKYDVRCYNIDMILAVGYRVRTKRAIEFRNWASEIIKRYLKNKEDNLSNVESNYIRLEKMIFEIQDDIIDLKRKVDNSPQKEYLFLKGQFFDSYDLICS